MLVAVGLYLVAALERGSQQRERLVASLCLLLGVGYVMVLVLPVARHLCALGAPDRAAAGAP
jgi:predicted membrane protein